MIDWSSAFTRQCPKLGVESFIDNGVRGSLIPLLINYFQDRVMTLKHHGCYSTSRKLNGGGPMGGTLGVLEYLSQSNHNADCVAPDDRYKFVDDLSILEIINLLNVGLSSFNNISKRCWLLPSKLPDESIRRKYICTTLTLKYKQ